MMQRFLSLMFLTKPTTVCTGSTCCLENERATFCRSVPELKEGTVECNLHTQHQKIYNHNQYYPTIIQLSLYLSCSIMMVNGIANHFFFFAFEVLELLAQVTMQLLLGVHTKTQSQAFLAQQEICPQLSKGFATQGVPMVTKPAGWCLAALVKKA